MRLGQLIAAILVLAIVSWPALAQERTQTAPPQGLGEVSGSGRIRLDGEPRSFSIDVRPLADGSVTGHAMFDDSRPGRGATGWQVDGMVVDGSAAYVCCINVSADDPWFGTRWVFRAVDNGARGAPFPDQLSLPRGPVLLSCDHPEFLEFRRSVDSAALHDVVAGDMEVRSLSVH